MAIHFELKHYRDLSTDELYRIMQLRQRVFVVEQNCAFLDCDGLDQSSWHLICYEGDILAAYCRLLPEGVSYAGFVSIGRVVSDPSMRGTGCGRQLMTEAITQCRVLFGDQPIQIGGQFYLKRFYESFGFVPKGDVYIEDMIDHIKMIRRWEDVL